MTSPEVREKIINLLIKTKWHNNIISMQKQTVDNITCFVWMKRVISTNHVEHFIAFDFKHSEFVFLLLIRTATSRSNARKSSWAQQQNLRNVLQFQWRNPIFGIPSCISPGLFVSNLSVHMPSEKPTIFFAVIFFQCRSHLFRLVHIIDLFHCNLAKRFVELAEKK